MARFLLAGPSSGGRVLIAPPVGLEIDCCPLDTALPLTMVTGRTAEEEVTGTARLIKLDEAATVTRPEELPVAAGRRTCLLAASTIGAGDAVAVDVSLAESDIDVPPMIQASDMHKLEKVITLLNFLNRKPLVIYLPQKGHKFM